MITGLDVFNRMKKIILEKYKDLDIKKIEDAYILANEAHKGQLRKSGEEYIVHPLEVAEILLSFKMDTDTIVAGILHDVVEDTLITLSDLEYTFGKEVSMMVDGVTKLRNLPQKEGKQIENIRKMVVAMSEDVRVVIIKLADRLHNMRTLKYQTLEKQVEKSKECMNIFAPIAHRIGMGKIKTELEDIGFYYLNPKGYLEIKNLLNTKKEKREKYTALVIDTVKKELKKSNMDFEVYGRPKHFYSIYRKMYENNKKFSELMDLIAIRVITQKEVDCYAVLGIIHSMFEPISSRFKDYIAAPKPNGYRSIHTTVKGPENQIVEIQIRTEQMHMIAEEGVAAHWKYKERKAKDKNEEYHAAVKKIIGSNIDNFAKEVTVEFLSKTIFVFTPKGDVIELQRDSTVLDFAFQIHTQIGYRTIGAKVNDKIVPLNYVVENGDKIEILTSKTTKGPGNDWINMVSTPSSKSKIKKWFKDQEFEFKAKQGEEILNEEFLKIGLKFKDYEDDERLLLYMKKFNIYSLKQLYYKFATNQLYIDSFISKFEVKEKLNIEEVIAEETSKTSNKNTNKNISGIKVTGSDNTLFNFAKCCSPLPGDIIKGYVSRGRGIVIHRDDCINMLKLIENEPNREMEVFWDEKLLEKSNASYQVSFTIKAYDRSGLLLDIMKLINEFKLNIVNVQTNVNNQIALITFSLLIRKTEDFDRLCTSLKNTSDVISILRK